MQNEEIWNECLKFGIQQKKIEFIELLNILKKNNVKTILELGVWDGGSSRGFLEISDKLISLDSEKRSGIYELEKLYPDKYTFIKTDTRFISARNKVENILNNRKIDFLFIDCSHIYEDVKADWETHNIFVKSGGIVGFHDIVDSPDHRKQNCFVSKLWNEIKNNYNHLELQFGEADWAGIGLIWKE